MWTRQDFGERLRTELMQAGLTARQLAQVLGRTERQVSFYLDGTNAPTPEGLRRIASALHVPIDYLWPEQGDELTIYRVQVESIARTAAALAQRLGLEPGQVRALGRMYTSLGTVDRAAEAVARPADTLHQAVEVFDATTGQRVSFLTLEVPSWVRAPRGLYDPHEHAIVACDLGTLDGPTFVRMDSEGHVYTTDDPAHAVGTHLATVQLAPCVRFAVPLAVRA